MRRRRTPDVDVDAAMAYVNSATGAPDDEDEAPRRRTCDELEVTSRVVRRVSDEPGSAYHEWRAIQVP